MKVSLRWNWLIVPLALALGSAGGVVIDRQILLRIPGMNGDGANLVHVAPPKPPEAPPVAEAPLPPGFLPLPSGGSPFEADPFTTPSRPAEGMPAPAPPKVEPPFIVRDGRVVLDPPPGYFELPAPDKKDGTDPPVIRPGQFVQVDVLEALPGRPITGDRVVRPDGTIGLYFYGDLHVAGLNRYQIKVKVLEHLRKFINDETLGLVGENEDGSRRAIPPVESSRVFVDESINYWNGDASQTARPATKIGFPDQSPTNARFSELEKQLGRLVDELGKLREERRPSDPDRSVSDRPADPSPSPAKR